MNLITHQRIHSGERAYACKVCGKSFSHQSYLAIHQRIHRGERPYTCDMCKKEFRQKASLIQHQHIHTGERPYLCELCNKTFNQKSILKKHKPYTVVSDGISVKAFSQQSSLIKHQHLHSGERQYKCEVCSKS